MSQKFHNHEWKSSTTYVMKRNHPPPHTSWKEIRKVRPMNIPKVRRYKSDSNGDSAKQTRATYKKKSPNNRQTSSRMNFKNAQRKTCNAIHFFFLWRNLRLYSTCSGFRCSTAKGNSQCNGWGRISHNIFCWIKVEIIVMHSSAICQKNIYHPHSLTCKF